MDPCDGFDFIQNGGPGCMVVLSVMPKRFLLGYVLSSSQIAKAKNESLPEVFPALT